MTPKQAIRVRIAPSPTGYFHIGTARAALFNWLFARHFGGTFIVRIEDTDKERSEKKFEQDIFEGLHWLGLEADESPEKCGAYGPYRQSERIGIYKKYLEKLIAERRAYYCFCSKEELDAVRQSQLTSGQAPKYNGRCRNIILEEAEKRRAKGDKSVIRFWTPDKTVGFTDMIRGLISFDLTLTGDFVIAKDLENSLYNFAVVVDDYEMEISHVIRGEDHIANTPKQIVMQEALGFPMPQYAHLPLILDPDRSKMSKRNSATALCDYTEDGYLAEAVFNFISLLGWHPVGDKEIMSVEEIIKEFSLERVQKAGAVFNLEKLEWLNGQYLRQLPRDILLEKIKSGGFLKSDIPKDQVVKALALVSERMKKLSDFSELTDLFWRLPEYDGRNLIWKKSTRESTIQALTEVREIIQKISGADLEKNKLEKILQPVVEKLGRGEVLWPLRFALSGQEASPGPYEILAVIGQEEAIRRIDVALQKLKEIPSI